MTDEKELKRFLEKVEKVTKQKELDLSSDEDLSIGIMNLISIEEHLFFTAQKTGKTMYYELLKQAREMRKELLKKIIKDYEGEVWCTSKHLLAASMRLMEVGTKQLGKGNDKEAHDLFDKSFKLYSLFWALNLNLIDSGSVKQSGIIPEKELEKDKEIGLDGDTTGSAKMNMNKADSGFFDKMSDVLKKAIDCCKE